ncbi:UTP--glucose-1-phosphate uridylyltransferase [bacterium]|nr:UTP--glucose-1-phosphate uridylyltransferase [bacterium]
MTSNLKQIEEIMMDQDYSPDQILMFGELYKRFIAEKDTKIDWFNISTPSDNQILNYESLEEIQEDKIATLLSELAVCRLNGGLGTSMGCVGPKSAIEVKNGLSILDLIVEQIHMLNLKYGSQVPLVLMNSYSTDQDTQKIIGKYDNILPVYTFRQNEFPRLRTDSLLPLSKQIYGQQCSYPPGHGDFYHSIDKTGVLDQLLKNGKKYMYIANADNLGASVDLNILNLMEKSGAPFIMEVTDKTRADVKGGTLIKTKNGSMRLLELAQVPKDHIEDFKSVKKFKIFNTNNIWINLVELKKKLQSNTLHLDIIVNRKNLEHLPIIQLETAIGSGINNFEGGLAVKVPRIRFIPIKKTDDLLLVQSNLYIFEEGIIKKNPDRQFGGIPLIRLGNYFQTVEEYQNRFASIPDILDLDLLTIVGNVYFGKNITLRGNVILVCERGELNLPDNSLLENKVLTGSIQMGEL